MKSASWWNGFFSLTLMQLLTLMIWLIWTHNQEGIIINAAVLTFFTIFWFSSFVEATK